MNNCVLCLVSNSPGFPPALWDTSVRRFALRDYLTRRFGEAVRAAGGDVAAGGGGGWHGAKGGDMCVDRPGQHVLDRTSVVITSKRSSLMQVHRPPYYLPVLARTVAVNVVEQCQSPGGHVNGGDGRYVLPPTTYLTGLDRGLCAAGELLEARFEVGLPARGRTVLGAMAAHILVDQLPGYVAAGLLHSRQDAAALRRHVECVEDSQALRSQLAGLKLVAFVADGALLPRASGASDLPLASGGGGSGGARDGALGGGGGGGVSCAVVPFRAPDSLAVEVVLPHSGVVRGMGLPEGVTLICGGGFHGKSTLLQVGGGSRRAGRQAGGHTLLHVGWVMHGTHRWDAVHAVAGWLNRFVARESRYEGWSACMHASTQQQQQRNKWLRS